MSQEFWIPAEDDTARLRAVRLSAGEQIRQLTQRANEVLEMVRSQRDLLRQRGMNLPPGSLESLKTFKSQVDRLQNTIAGTLTELKQLRALANTTSLINSSLDTADVLNQVMDTVIQITGAERGYIALIDRETGQMDFPVRRGIDREQMESSDLVVSTSIVKEVASSGKGVLTENASKDDRFQGHQSVIGFQLRSILAVPLKVRDSVIGVVYCDNRIIEGIFKPHDLNLLEAFANQAGVAIENARLFEDLRARIAQVTEARDLMTRIFDSIVSGVITISRDDRITDSNAAAESILRLPPEAVLQQPVASVLSMLGDTFMTALRRVREAGTQERLEVNPTLADGSRIWAVTLSPLRDAQGESQGIVMVLDDLTESRRREEQLGIASRYMKLGLETLSDVDVLSTGGEEREISVLHSDVRGFTTFSEQLAPEKLMEIINSYISLSSDAINLYDGIVDKYMGDAVTGLFNTSFNPQEDHALRAVRAAMSMKYDLLALHEVLPEEQRLFYGIGVHTGMAVLGNIGGVDRKEFGALGDAPDLAKLLQENAQRGEVLISQETYDAVKDYYECEALEPRKTKDYPGFTVMYRVLRHKRR
ncbi:MAG: GAF domain-containing protein [Anaerolineae bacterium]|nr:GAF domain-containing protein [Anaerolineae bacterium]